MARPIEATPALDLVVLVTPAPDLPGQWIAHVLNLDLVTQGDSVEHALEMSREAVALVLEDDLSRGLDSFQRRRAEPTFWQLVTEALQSGLPLPSVADRSRIRAAVARLQVTLAPNQPEAVLDPPAWQVAALNDMRSIAPL